jgi:hypothetical protein
MPFVSEPTGWTPTDLVGEGSPKFLRPQTDRLMRNNDPPRRQHALNHPQAQRKAEIQPHGVGNDLSREAMAAIKRITVCHNPSSHTEIHVPLS